MLFRVEREAFLPLLIWSFAVGILFGAVYDLLRIRRVAFRLPRKKDGEKAGKVVSFFRRHWEKTDTVLIFFEDLIFSLFCTVTLILLDFRLYFGVPRWYSAAAALLGFLLYYVTVGKLVIRSAERLISLLRRAVGFLLLHTLFPALRIVKSAWKALKRRRERKRRIRYTRKEEKRMLRLLMTEEPSGGGSGRAARPSSGNSGRENAPSRQPSSGHYGRKNAPLRQPSAKKSRRRPRREAPTGEKAQKGRRPARAGARYENARL